MNKLLQIVFVVVVTLAHTAYGQDPTIPADLVVTPTYKPIPIGKPSGAPIAISTLNDLSQVQLIDMGDCISGEFYVGVQLFYDFSAAKQTEIDWDADLQIAFINSGVEGPAKTLRVSSTNQTFETTQFNDQTITCSPDFKVKIIKKNINGPVPESHVKLQVMLYKKFETGFVPATTFSVLNLDGPMKTWSYNGKGVIAYDLEWVFVPDYEGYPVSCIAAFDKNPNDISADREPVRVTIAGSTYQHSLYYPKGKVYYRIRAIGFDPLYPEHRISGAWAYGTDSPAEVNNHEAKRSWTAQTVFIEGGKYKRMMSYLDGTQRVRQTQVNTNEIGSETVIVGEMLYDYEGRPAGEVMPVPTTTSVFAYQHNFNPFESSVTEVQANTSSMKRKFHYDNGVLTNSIIKGGGAATYYSKDVPTTFFYRDYLPDGEGYVYSATEYFNDGKSMPKKESTVGKEFRMEGGHATQTYLGDPAQTELVRLFGSNVGNASHYKKVLSVDQNKQGSVSYLDQEGRTIATALVGTPPTNLNTLPSYTKVSRQEEIGTQGIIQDGKAVLKYRLLNATIPTQYQFNYLLSAMPSNLVDLGFACQSCKYTVRIAITDPDGIALTFPDGKKYYEAKRITAATCSQAWATIEGTNFTFTFDKLGDYTIEKIVTPTEVPYDEAKTIVSQSTDVQSRIQLLNSLYEADAEDCRFCSEGEPCVTLDPYVEQAIDDITNLDCENIYKNIIRDLQISNYASDFTAQPKDDEIAGHADYCRYQLCVSDKESTKFERRLAYAATYSRAAQMNLVEAISNVYAANADPFFVMREDAGPVAGTVVLKVVMQLKLNNIRINDIWYDSNGDGNADRPFPVGTIASVTDPDNATYKVDEFGRLDPTKYHILYYELMKNKSTMTTAEYQQRLDAQRWALMMSYYLKAKREVKLDIDDYENCPTAKAEIERLDNLPDTKNEVLSWMAAEGVTDTQPLGPVTDIELDAIVNALIDRCGITFTTNELSTIKTNLLLYFNGNPSNLFHAIIKTDLNTPINPNLAAIQNILIPKGCNLSVMATASSVTCTNTASLTGSLFTSNAVINPEMDGVQAQLSANYVNSWAGPAGNVWYREFATGSVEAFGSCKISTLSGTLKPHGANNGLIPGQRYRLRLSVKTRLRNIGDDQHPNWSEVPVENLSFQLSNSFTANGCGATVGPVSPINVTTYWSGSAQTSTNVFSKSNIKTNDVYQIIETEFIPQSDCKYFFVVLRRIFNMSSSQEIFIQSVSIRPVNDINESNVCVSKTMAESPFSMAGLLHPETSCLSFISFESQQLFAYASEKLLNDEVSKFNERHAQNCLKIRENFSYTYNAEEYHHTLYYFDQAGNLVQTVPPEGVVPLSAARISDIITLGETDYPEHKMLTKYRHNSLNANVWEKTPDAGVSRFVYNTKGQLKLSQNAQQVIVKKGSYVKYDKLGRTVEVGEMALPDELSTYQSAVEDITFPLSASFALNDVTKTYYDEKNTAITTELNQTNLRNRVSWTESYETGPTNIAATYYSYDIHGNVNAVLQSIPGLGNKRIDYVYDLVSGNVNYVFYQNAKLDQLIHRYQYDANNRLQNVATSTDGFVFNTEAEYRYYAHGLLARIELGKAGSSSVKVQGEDFYYTLQGWIKGANMPYGGRTDVSVADPGNDGYKDVSGNGLNKTIGRDVFSYTVGYYPGDFTPSNITKVTADTRDKLWPASQAMYGATQTGLFNGNISWMITDLKKVGQDKGARVKGMQAMMYRYDQLNRLVQSRSLTTYNATTGFAARASGSTGAYDENFTYDGNGNIKTLRRWDKNGAMVDDFVYQYYRDNNRLRFYKPIATEPSIDFQNAIVQDDKVYRTINIGPNAFVPANKDVTIKAIENIDFAPENFDLQDGAAFHAYVLGEEEGIFNYDAIGNLIWDQEKGVKITWTPYGKVREVRKNDGSIVKFRYDAMGNRIEKKLTKADNTTVVTRYIRDASGIVMGTYNGKMLTEQPVYGSARIGTYRGGSHKLMRRQGTKNFELSNHLGNVLSVITDNLRMATDSTWAHVVNANDYYAFGMSMPGRQNVAPLNSPSNTSLSLPGFTYNDPDSKVLMDISNNFTIELWVNPTKTHQIDAQAASGTLGTAGQTYVVYPGSVTTAGESGAGISVGTNGVSVYEMAGLPGQSPNYAPPILVWSGTVTGWTHIAVVYTNKVPSLYINGVFKKTGLTSTKSAVHPGYGFMGNPLGIFTGGVDEIRIWNVSRTAAEIQASYNTVIAGNTPNLAAYFPMNEGKGNYVHDASNHGLDHALVNYSSWSATGAIAAVTTTEDNEYRYGFNGKEADSRGDEIGGDMTYDYGFRIHNPRLGRFLSVDPMARSFSWNSPYAYAENDPISSIDLDGLEKVKKTNLFTLSLKGIADGVNGGTASVMSVFTKNTYYEIKGAASDAIAGYTGAPGGMKRTVAFWTRFGVNSGKNVTQTFLQPINFVMTMPDRSAEENVYKVSYSLGYFGLFYVATEFGTFMLKGNPVGTRQIVSRSTSKSDLLNTKGLTIWNNAEATAYLNSVGGEAAYMSTEEGGIIILRQNASEQAIAEEIIHHNQKMKYGEEYFLRNRNALEVEAQDELLKLGEERGWTRESLDEIGRAKVEWQKKLGEE